MYRIGIDIGGTKINVGLFDEKKLIESKKEYIQNIKVLSEYVKQVVAELAATHGVSVNEIVSCGIGIPGTVSEDGRHILKAPNIDLLSDGLVEELEETLHIPVGLIQDSRAAAWGEYLVCEKKPKTLVCITLGTGIGTGIVIDGRIYHGALGAAGELGHLPVVHDGGRPCGCGATGCLEKYCAGGGLDLTAKELFGEGKSAADLFEEMKTGNEAAKHAISDAVKMLGAALVSIVNLLSPDCILFSGGLSLQTELYLNPVMEYIRSHCYRTHTLPEMRAATLADASPLYGAAWMPMQKTIDRKNSYTQISASIMCADVLHFQDALEEIERAGIEYIHADIMDNHFVPNLMLSCDLLNRLHQATELPFDFHIMAENPESIIDRLSIRENDFISVHYESTNHLQRVITKIKEKGARAAVALNPATPICVLDEIIGELDMVLIMSVNPGFAGQKIVPSSFEKIAKLKNDLRKRGLDKILIEVDGNCSFENAVKMVKAGADILVAGTSSVFHKDLSINEGVARMRALLS